MIVLNIISYILYTTTYTYIRHQFSWQIALISQPSIIIIILYKTRKVDENNDIDLRKIVKNKSFSYDCNGL